MDKLKAMEAFVAVCKEGGFSAASRALNKSKAQVSKLVSALEQELGVRLLNRTTRQHSLTEAGGDYLTRSRQVLQQVKESEESIKAQADVPRGSLMVTAPIAFTHRRLLPIIESFMVDYPEVKVHLELTNRHVDIIAEGYDLAIRVGDRDGVRADSGFMSKKIGETRHGFYASPAYLKARGTPQSFEDLASHDSIQNQNRTWKADGKTVATQCVMTSNDGDVIRSMALAGKGIIALPDFYVLDDLEAGRLIRLEISPDNEPVEVMALWPHRDYLPKKVRVFIDALADCLRC